MTLRERLEKRWLGPGLRFFFILMKSAGGVNEKK